MSQFTVKPAVIVALTVALSAAGCDWIWPSDARYDPRRCDPRCGPSTICVDGVCSTASSLYDLGPPDQLPHEGPDPNCVHAWVGMSCSADVCELPGGCFAMGSPSSEWCRGEDESRHAVTVARGLAVARTEVTQQQFSSLMGYNPSTFSTCGQRCPVESISWHEAAHYCNKLGEKQNKNAKKEIYSKCYSCSGAGRSVTCTVASAFGKSGARLQQCNGFRLPTEAEWEYTHRAGSTTAFVNGPILACAWHDAALDKVGWYTMNANSLTHPAGEKLPNRWGLYDTAGNVAEWVHDVWQRDLGRAWLTDPSGPADGQHRVVRGGSWRSHAGLCRSASRHRIKPDRTLDDVGFRWVRTLNP